MCQGIVEALERNSERAERLETLRGVSTPCSVNKDGIVVYLVGLSNATNTSALFLI